MKGKVLIIITALILAAGIFVLADKGNTTSAFSLKKNNEVNIDQSKSNDQAAGGNKEVTKNIVKNVDVTEKNIKYSNEFINVDMKIPVINGLKNTEIQNKINSRLEKDATSFKEENEKNAKQDSDNAKKENMEFRKYETVSQYTSQYNKDGYLSLTVDYYMYTGGAHGMTNRVAYNYDLNTGEEIKLSGLFNKDFNYKDFINKEIQKQMKAGEDIYFHDEGGFKTISDEQSYYISDGNIVIYFGLYEIAPYAAGFPEFKIPVSALKENMEIKL